MAARTYDQILAALDPGYAGSRKLLQDKMAMIPGEVDAGIAQTDAKLQVANQGILDGARRRGLGFSGIPVAEQAQYAATDYAPAIAKMKSDGANRATSLQEALLGYDRDQRTQAQSIYDGELARDFQERQFAEQQRQFNEQQAAAARAASAAAGGGYSFGGGGGGAPAGNPAAQQSQAMPKYGFKNGKDGSAGFWFTDPSGKAISAAKYASLSGTNISAILGKMASSGDKTAALVAAQMRGPGVSTQLANKYKAFFW